MFSRKRIDSKKPCKLSMNTLLGLRIIVTFWKYYVSKLFTGLVCVFVRFWDRDYVSQLPGVRYYVFVKIILNILVKNASPRGSMCFRCLIFSLSGPCKLFLLCFIASWT